MFLEDQVYDWGRFQKTGLHTRTKITLPLHRLTKSLKKLVAARSTYLFVC